MSSPSFALLLAFLLLAQFARAGVDYAREIKPLLKARCYACHGALKQKAGLRVDTAALMRKGGESGNVLEASAPLLLQRVTSQDKEERMPPEGAALTPDEIGRLKAWIAAGASAPADEQPQPDPRQHWAYQPPKASEPAVTIDALLDARLAARGLRVQAEAAPEVWLRRVYLDLTGLPPSAEEVRGFLARVAGDAEAARQEVVDRLLASPAYGERWGRHFMDIWRYCDWYGLGPQLRHSQKHLWHWRDWIVESLNADKGYDRMIVEMLAADEAAPKDRDALRATGFLCRSYYLFNRTTWLDETIEHTSRAFLGVTMQCVKCHDHKYDPISQADYYRLRAVFEPYHVRLDPWPGEPDLEKNGLPRSFDLHLAQPTYLHRRGDEKNVDQSRSFAPGVPEVLAFGEFHPQPVTLPASAAVPATLPFVLDDQLVAAQSEIASARKALQKASRALARERREELDDAEAAVDRLTSADGPVRVAEAALAVAQAKAAWLRAAAAAEAAEAASPAQDDVAELKIAAAKADAEFQKARAGAEVEKARQAVSMAPKEKLADANKKLQAAEQALAKATQLLAKPAATYTHLRASLKAQEGPEDKNNADFQVYPSTSTGRRLALARWIADERNPLTARVLVNHVWMRHFGTSFVPDPSDFGLRAPAPLHQDVLDALAVDFVRHGWSLKHLHRTVVLSKAYRRSSSNAGAEAATLAADPDNSCYWRANPRRLESQAVRDALLSAAGRLDLRRGGPSIDPAKEEASVRRALYFAQTADVEHRFLAAFDNNDVLECYRRQESVVPQQALALANSSLTRTCAEAIAARGEALAESDFIEEIFLSLLTRYPTSSERTACAETLAELARLHPSRKRAVLVQALLNHNDFVTVR